MLVAVIDDRAHLFNISRIYIVIEHSSSTGKSPIAGGSGFKSHICFLFTERGDTNMPLFTMFLFIVVVAFIVATMYAVLVLDEKVHDLMERVYMLERQIKKKKDQG